MILRMRALFASAGLVAALGVMTVVHADEIQVPSPDAATITAITNWRADAVTRVTPSLQGAVAAMYADQPVDASLINAAAIARVPAEQAAWANLDAASASLISSYFDAVSTSTYASFPLTTENNDG